MKAYEDHYGTTAADDQLVPIAGDIVFCKEPGVTHRDAIRVSWEDHGNGTGHLRIYTSSGGMRIEPVVSNVVNVHPPTEGNT